MLTDLSIYRFALIDEVHLSFTHHFSVITGETGAGKSITVDALSVVLGGKTDINMIQFGHEQAEISASFDLTQLPSAQQYLQAQDLPYDDNICVIRRIIQRNGRSKAYINQRLVSLSVVRDLGEYLLDIHGQHAHQSLAKKETQRQLLDQFADSLEDYKIVQKTARALEQLDKEIHQLQQQDAAKHERIDFLQFQLTEFEQLKLQPQEWKHITHEFDRLNQLETASTDYQEALHQLNDEQYGIVPQLSRLQSRIHNTTKKNPTLNSINQLLEQALICVQEAENELEQKIQHIEFDPEQLAYLDRRMQILNQLARKHRIQPEQLSEKYTQLQQEMNKLQSTDVEITSLIEQRQQQQMQWHATAQQLTLKRQQAAQQLNQQISERLQMLAMSGGHFEVAFQANPAFHATGQETIIFLVTANIGQPLKPLDKVASGGELARINLAIAVILGLKTSLPVLVFDEVDTGVGGAVAEIIGENLQKLSIGRQILCVTHLAQVASYGHQHYVVVKHQSIAQTQTQIKQLNSKERVEEIARMIGGIRLTKTTYQHAQELLKNAHTI